MFEFLWSLWILSLISFPAVEWTYSCVIQRTLSSCGPPILSSTIFPALKHQCVLGLFTPHDFKYYTIVIAPGFFFLTLSRSYPCLDFHVLLSSQIFSCTDMLNRKSPLKAKPLRNSSGTLSLSLPLNWFKPWKHLPAHSQSFQLPYYTLVIYCLITTVPNLVI